MNRFVTAAVFAGFAAIAVPAAAQAPQQAYSAASSTAPAYNDPAMSFTAPADYVKADIPAHDPANFDGPTVVAGFMKAGKNAPRIAITIEMSNFDGTLDGFEAQAENELRGQADSVFIRKQQTTLTNGMPAYWQDITVGSGFTQLKRYQYVWIDGLRGVELSIMARDGDITEAEAKRALANVSAVAYPHRDF
jgi:hypothetical protein